MVDNSNIKCNFHNQDYKLYCKDCKECICMECLENDLHHMHSFCKLKDARNGIFRELQTFVTKNGEHNSETADHFAEKLKRKIEKFKGNELLIKTQIIDGTEEMIRHIKSSKDELLTSLEQQFYKHNEHIKIVQDSLKTICSSVNNVDIDTIKDDQIVNLHVEMRRCISTCKDILSKDEKPTFIQNPNCAVGYFTNIKEDCKNAGTVRKSADGNDINNKSHKLDLGVAVQAECYKNVTAIKDESNQHESSSDELQEDYPITISFDKNEGNIDKIFPTADQDAWVIISRKLRKMKNRVLESTKYVTADDIVVLKDGSVIVLNRYEKFVTKLLLDGRVVPFACMDNYTPMSLCLKDHSVFISMTYYDSNKSRTVFSNINSFSVDGIISSTWDVSSLHFMGSPESIFHVNRKEMSFCILCKYCSENYKLSTIHLVNQKNKDARSTNSADVKWFQGSFGLMPNLQFKCNGICTDNNNTIVVSDTTYRCVYALDENIKFKKFIISNSDYNLESPGAIAIYNNLLWVADGKKILIFRYDFKK